MTDEIKFNTFGRIIQGEYRGWYVYVKPDYPESPLESSYLILTLDEYPPNKSTEGYDSWVEDYDSLDQFFSESGWKIDWVIKKE